MSVGWESRIIKTLNLVTRLRFSIEKKKPSSNQKKAGAKKAKRQKTKEGGPRSVGDEDDEGTSENKDKGVAVDEEDAGFFLSDDDSA